MSEDFTRKEFNALFHPTNPSPEFQGGEKRLRQMCALSVQAFPGQEPLKTFTFVGAPIFDLDLPQEAPSRKVNTGHRDYEISHREIVIDVERFRGLLTYFIRSGIAVSPDFTVKAPHLMRGEDYLQDTSTSDVVILGYIPQYFDDSLPPDVRKDRKIGLRMNSGGAISQHDPRDLYQQSAIRDYSLALDRKDYHSARYHSLRMGSVYSGLGSTKNWMERIERAKPKAVITYLFQHEASFQTPMPLEFGEDSNLKVVIGGRDETSKLFQDEMLPHYRQSRIVANLAFSQGQIADISLSLTDRTLMSLRLQATLSGHVVPTAKSGYSGKDGYKDGAQFIPVPPFRKPCECAGLSDEQYLDFFYALARAKSSDQIQFPDGPGIKEAIIKEVTVFYGGRQRPTVAGPALPKEQVSPPASSDGWTKARDRR